jgi:hypothetical protein
MLDRVNRERKYLYCRSLYQILCPKQTNNKAAKRPQHQNRKKYDTMVEEIRLQLIQVM